MGTDLTTVAPLYATAIIASVFAFAGVTKLIQRDDFALSLAALSLVSPATGKLVSRGLPVAEVAIGVALISGYRDLLFIGVLTGIALLAAFIAVALRAVRMGNTEVRCTCFGPLSNSTFGPSLIVRNAALVVIAAYLLASLIWSVRTPDLFSVTGMLAVLLPVTSMFPLYALTDYVSTSRAYYTKPVIYAMRDAVEEVG